jgi:tRNA (mo5U34)-methyltransferase
MATRLLEHIVSAPSLEREREIASLGPWFHNLHLPDGAQTAPAHRLGDFPRFKWDQIAPYIGADLTGVHALDIGCNAGFYTFELAKRGATVLGIDVEPLFLGQARWAAREFGLERSVRFERMQVYDLAHTSETFDIVLFMGVLYHLRYPMLALDIVTQKVRDLLVFQTLTMEDETVQEDTARDRDIMDRAAFEEPGWPRMAFIEHTFAGDPTNWWVPNHAAVEAMLRTCGMRVVDRPGHELYLCTRGHAGWTHGDGAAEYRSAVGQGRAARKHDGAETP